MPSLSSVTGRRSRARKVSLATQARIQAEAESVAEVTGPPTPPGLELHDEAMAGARRAASSTDLEDISE